jgi:peptidoglycan hydrolase-like protein with peptidoglycan-binding domain
MPNPGQPTIHVGAVGDAVRRLQRALDRTGPGEALVVDGSFGPQTEAFVREFQSAEGLAVDGIVGPATWAALPNGGPMPVLAQGSHGAVVASLQRLLANGAAEWGASPGPDDGDFGPMTKAAVHAFQTHFGLTADGIVGERTWDTSLGAAGATLEKAVGVQFALP